MTEARPDVPAATEQAVHRCRLQPGQPGRHASVEIARRHTTRGRGDNSLGEAPGGLARGRRQADPDIGRSGQLGGEEVGEGMRLAGPRPAHDDRQQTLRHHVRRDVLRVGDTVDDRGQQAVEHRCRHRRRHPSPSTAADGDGDGALVDPVALGIHPMSEQHEWSFVEHGDLVDRRHLAYRRADAQRGQPPRQGRPRQWCRHDRRRDLVAVGEVGRQLGGDEFGDRVEVDARVAVLRGPQGEGEGEHHEIGVGVRFEQFGHHRRGVHLGRSEHPGVEPRLDDGDARRHGEHQRRLPPRNRASSSSTVRAGGCHENTPNGRSSTVGVSVPIMPRTNR